MTPRYHANIRDFGDDLPGKLTIDLHYDRCFDHDCSAEHIHVLDDDDWDELVERGATR